ncbi:hypothetical protein DXG03_001920 [Asterophora parasitica]|uniref:Uncharacterized protein n=1 Tax=Asterophora parasitica TaxID=117018 RepID=A0A9P7G3F3_9AGAR|nr:hypothetical protein DXG03_001920 [Asterophora parasitica]
MPTRPLDDGSLRVYDLSTFKVIKAVRGLGAEVSSLACVKRPGSELRDVWLASGRRVLKFQMDSPKMIQSVEDALVDVDLTEEGQEDDILNELALNTSKTHIAFSMDSGTVGVVDIATKVLSRMKSKHESVMHVCGSVRFIPDRPREIVSGGYDTALLHFDFHEGKILSTRRIPPYAVVGGMSLSPPFVMSTAISSTGLIAAGTADGRLYIGCGGYKVPKAKGSNKKRSRKWEGLKDDEEVIIKIAEGPIVAVVFEETGMLTLSTLLGVMIRFEVEFEEGQGNVSIVKVWQQETQGVKKVNTLVVDDKRVVVGGLTADGQGIFEIWKKEVADIAYSLYGLSGRKS